MLIIFAFAVFLTSTSVNTTNIRCSFVFLGNLTPPVPYKCIPLGVDVQKENTNISAIGGYHHYRKDNMNVEKVEFVSTWSTYLPNGFGEFFPFLIDFEVRDTPLKSIKRSNFAGMNKLTILSIENTKLASIPEDAFAEVVNLQELKIAKSQLRTFPPNFLLPLPKLRSFDAKYNRITKLDRDLFTDNPKIESINFNRNHIREIDINFQRFGKLIEVYLFKCACINSYYIKSSSRYTLSSLNMLVKKRCKKS